MTEYSEYKESGQQWLGKVPSHWEILPGKAIFEENNTSRPLGGSIQTTHV